MPKGYRKIRDPFDIPDTNGRKPKKGWQDKYGEGMLSPAEAIRTGYWTTEARQRMDAEFQAAMLRAVAKGKETCATSPSTCDGTFKPMAGYRPPETYTPPVVTAPSIAPVDELDQPFQFKPISFYDSKLKDRSGEEESPD